MAGAWFAFIGWLDDLGVFFSTLPRLGAQFIGAILALSMLSGVPPIVFLGIPLGTVKTRMRTAVMELRKMLQ